MRLNEGGNETRHCQWNSLSVFTPRGGGAETLKKLGGKQSVYKART